MAPWIVENYYDTRGRAPVDEYLKTLPPVDQARVLRAIDLLIDYGPLLKMPHVRHLAGKIWELRNDGRPNSYGSTAPHVPHIVRGRARTKVYSVARIQEKGAEDPIRRAGNSPAPLRRLSGEVEIIPPKDELIPVFWGKGIIPSHQKMS